MDAKDNRALNDLLERIQALPFDRRFERMRRLLDVMVPKDGYHLSLIENFKEQESADNQAVMNGSNMEQWQVFDFALFTLCQMICEFSSNMSDEQINELMYRVLKTMVERVYSDEFQFIFMVTHPGTPVAAVCGDIDSRKVSKIADVLAKHTGAKKNTTTVVH